MKAQKSKSTTVSWLVALALLLGACQTAATETPPSTTDEAETTAEPAPLTPTPGPVGEEPPAAILRIGDQVQESGIGSYCWPGVGGEVAVCADKIGIPTSQVPLQSDLSLTAAFELPLEEPPSTAVLTVKQVSDADEMESSVGGYRWWEPTGGEQFLLPLEVQPQIELTLDEGLYVFNVFTQWQGTGDVSYGFLVEARMAQGAEIPTVETDVAAIVTLQDDVPFYSGPSLRYEPVATSYTGVSWPVTGASADGDWWQLRCLDAAGDPLPQCWVSADPAVTVPTGTDESIISTLPTNVKNVLVLAIFGINSRSEPDVEADIIDIRPLGQLVEVTGMSEDEAWWRVRCSDGTVGDCWISADPALSTPTQVTDFSLEGLAYQPVEEQLQLWIVQADGLPALEAEGFRGAVSPDGKSALRCCVSRDSLDQLTLIDLETSDETTLVEETDLLVQAPTWWPARPETVFFLSKTTDALGQPSGPGLGYLSVVNTDGSGYELLDSENNTHALPSLSPDGRTIAYTRGDDRNFNNDIFTPWLFALESGPVAFDYAAYGLDEFPDLSFGAPAWSPDGTRLAWVIAGQLGEDDDFRVGIAMFDLQANTVEIVAQYLPSDAQPERVTSFEGPTWNPDGEWLAWSAFPAATPPGFWVFPPDGAEFIYFNDAFTPTWSPDGRLLAFNLSDTILVMESGVWEIQHSNLPDGNLVLDWVNLEE